MYVELSASSTFRRSQEAKSRWIYTEPRINPGK
jgi:hypothetical protein